MKSIFKHKRDSGFTLIELMIVIVIIGVLLTIVTLNFSGATERAKLASTKASMKTIKGALEIYKGSYNAYPPSGVGLTALMAEKLLKEDSANDSFGTPFQYYSPLRDHGYELTTAGPDKQFGTPDDYSEYPEK